MNLTKIIFNTMKGAPVLASEWGSLLNVIRTVCITGFNENLVQSYEQSGDTLVLNFSVDHGYIKDQIITLSGTEQEEANTEYEVKSVFLRSLTLKLYSSDTIITGILSCKTSPLGWTEVFSGDNKAVFRAKNIINNPFYLRIDNSCPIGYDPVWGKFARVTMSDGIVNIDEYGDFIKAPVYQNVSRDMNELGNKITGATGIFGIAKWYHGVSIGATNYLVEARTEEQSSNANYEIIGDNSSLYFMPRITTRRDSRALYAFTPFIKLNSNDQFNCFMSATHHYKRANQSDGENYNTGNNSIENRWYSLVYDGKYLLSNWNGISNTTPTAGPFSLNLGNNQQISGRSADIPFPNPIDNAAILSDVYLKESSNGGIRGTLPLIKWIANNWSYGHKFVFTKDNEKYIVIGNDYNDEGMSSFFAYKLER